MPRAAKKPRCYGRPHVLVPQPDGDPVPYLIDAIPAPARVWRAWALLSPDGTRSIVC